MKKQLIKEAFRLQQIAGIVPINEINGELEKFLDAIYDTLNDEMRLGNFTEQGLRKADTYLQKNGQQLFNSGYSPRDIADDFISKSNTGKHMQREQMGQAQITSFSPKEIKSVSFSNGTAFTVGDTDMEGGIVISIEKTAEGFEVSGYGDGEGYTYYYDKQGNEMEMESAKPGLQKEVEAGKHTKKVIFSFFDSDVENTARKFQKLGFDIELDRREEGDEGEDDIETYYAGLDLTDYDMMNIRQVLDDCERMGLQVAVEIGDNIYDSVKDAQEIDSLIAQNPDLI